MRYSVLVPNLKGPGSRRAHPSRRIVVFTAASEAFSQKNINCSIAERHRALRARGGGWPERPASRCGPRTVLRRGCPYEGDIAPERGAVGPALPTLQHAGVADTIGVGTRAGTKALSRP